MPQGENISQTPSSFHRASVRELSELLVAYPDVIEGLQECCRLLTGTSTHKPHAFPKQLRYRFIPLFPFFLPPCILICYFYFFRVGTVTYDESGKPLFKNDVNGEITSAVYDTQGWPITIGSDLRYELPLHRISYDGERYNDDDD